VRRDRRVEIRAVTLTPPPEHLGVTYWSSRLLASELGVSHSTVARVWAEHDIRPWQTETFKFSTDPQLEAKVRDVVGLYLDPPAHAIVLCVDEKSQIQALERTQPVRPVAPGRVERRTHDYLRHGTTTLFAALEVATGRITDACQPRHRHGEFLAFLKLVAKAYPRRPLHVVVDNYATHKHQRVQAWLEAHPPRPTALHPDLWVLAQPGRGVLRDHRAPSPAPRRLRQRPGANRCHRPVLRWLESTLPAVSLDQRRRPDPHQAHAATHRQQPPLEARIEAMGSTCSSSRSSGHRRCVARIGPGRAG
jgi:transposase